MPPALQLALLVVILLPAVKVAASVCERWRIPPILGELLVGVALGPGAVDLLHLRHPGSGGHRRRDGPVRAGLPRGIDDLFARRGVRPEHPFIASRIERMRRST